MRVAALYVDTARGAYVGLPGVDLWGYASRDGRQQDAFAPTRDAREYAGPWPVVAHPPCGPWGRFRRRYLGGEGDRDCGPTAVSQVRRYGGVLEHPAWSTLWPFCGMKPPGPLGMSADLDECGGFTLAVDQCRWGHPARKPTWLYVVGATVSEFPPDREPTHVMVRLLRNGNDRPEVPKRDRHLTPPAFARWLVAAARTVERRC
jgi:hypothetical protein